MADPLIRSEPVAGFWRGFMPNHEGPFPAVMLFHGSGGAQSGGYLLQAMFLAAHGYLAVPYGYSKDTTIWDAGCIRNIELLDTVGSLRALRKNPLCNNRVCLFGSSRGAEHVLLLASLMAKENIADQADCIVAHAPADVVFPAFDSRCVRPRSDPGHREWDAADPAWLWRGTSDPIKPGSAIEVEHCKMPLMITHGTNDQVWSYEMTKNLQARLDAAGKKPEIHYFENEGHGFSAHAENRFNTLLLSFLERSLRS
ncbi:MAG: acyl-CoA thioester hydrolase/BAAT C-terminal domain-containing protein [Pseudomonadota bacterium]